jgi:glutamate 5-kinase
MLAESIMSQIMVVKIGSSTITKDGNPLNLEFMDNIARQVAEIRSARGTDVLIVSSGAVACGIEYLKSTGHERWQHAERGGISVAMEQSAASYGQPLLMRAWGEAFSKYNLPVAQKLYLAYHPERVDRHQNMREVLELDLEVGVPVINANDAVSDVETKRIKENRDNDYLAFSVAHMVNADILVFLTDEDGVLDNEGKLVKFAHHWEDVADFVREPGILVPIKEKGIGGMLSKTLSAGEFIYRAPFRTALIANGRRDNVLVDAAQWNEEAGTWFATHKFWRHDRNYRRWHLT